MRVYDRSRLKTRNVEAICRHFRSPAAIGSKSEVMRNWILPAPRPKDDIAAIRNKPYAASVRWACAGGIMISLSAAAVLASSPGNDPDKVKFSSSAEDHSRYTKTAAAE